MCSLQDVIRCDICETPVPPKHCDVCNLHLCNVCVEEHLLDESIEHCLVPFSMRGISPKCPKHSENMCKRLCEECNIPICSICVVSGEHDKHKKTDIIPLLEDKIKIMNNDLKELIDSILPKYQDALSKIPSRKDKARKYSQAITAALQNQGEALHKEINAVIKKMQRKNDDMYEQHLAVIDKQEVAINRTLTEMSLAILDLKNILDTRDICLASKYESRNEGYNHLPIQFEVILPTFNPKEINSKQMYQQFGFLSEQVITYSARQFIDEPKVVTDITTEFGENSELRSLSCVSDDEFWTCGYNTSMELYNMQGELLESVQTNSKNYPFDIDVTRSKDLVYADYNDSDECSINVVSNTQIKPLIVLQGWRPLGLCSTSSGNLLVIMDSDDKKQSKVVRYSGSTEKQSIQWDDQGQPLFSSGGIFNYKNLSENKNLDICVADSSANAVVVVSAAGKLRFRHTGYDFFTERLFGPVSIATDSQSNILTAFPHDQLIEILNQDGHLLRIIKNCGLHRPWGLCLDSRDYLLVAEGDTGLVKKIQYYQ